MEGLYPIIRRYRRPLVSVAPAMPAAAPAGGEAPAANTAAAPAPEVNAQTGSDETIPEKQRTRSAVV